jgi:uncharacterized membrane protein affecting hemolysin expression
MPEVKLPEAGITFEGVIYVIALAVAVSGVLVALVKGWEAWKKISVRDRVRQLEGRMEKVEARLKLGDKRFDLQNDDMGHMLNTQQALLLHFISGNDHERLRTQLTELGNYMAERATKIQRYAEEQNEIISGGD